MIKAWIAVGICGCLSLIGKRLLPLPIGIEQSFRRATWFAMLSVLLFFFGVAQAGLPLVWYGAAAVVFLLGGVYLWRSVNNAATALEEPSLAADSGQDAFMSTTVMPRPEGDARHTASLPPLARADEAGAEEAAEGAIYTSDQEAIDELIRQFLAHAAESQADRQSEEHEDETQTAKETELKPDGAGEVPLQASDLQTAGQAADGADETQQESIVAESAVAEAAYPTASHEKPAAIPAAALAPAIGQDLTETEDEVEEWLRRRSLERLVDEGSEVDGEKPEHPAMAADESDWREDEELLVSDLSSLLDDETWQRPQEEQPMTVAAPRKEPSDSVYLRPAHEDKLAMKETPAVLQMEELVPMRDELAKAWEPAENEHSQSASDVLLALDELGAEDGDEPKRQR